MTRTCSQVKSRRQQREHQRTVLLKAQAAEKESRVAAERLVRSEQEAVKMEQKHEEALVRLEMVKIRKQLKEKQEREKLVSYSVLCGGLCAGVPVCVCVFCLGNYLPLF